MANEQIKPDNKKTSALVTAVGKKTVSPARLLMLTTILVSLAAIITSGYAIYQVKQVKRDLGSLSIAQEKLNNIDAALTRLQVTNRKLQQTLAEQAANQESMAAGLASVRKQESITDRDWLLADIEHLITIAVQRLTLDGDVPVALAAMQSADSRLRDYDDPELLPLRRQITTDINSLKAVTSVDISGLALYLLDIASRAGELPLKKLPGDEQATDEATGSEGEQSDKPAWRRFADQIVTSLKGLVKVYHEGEGSTLSLLPEQRYYLYQNLRLQLETATRAVLHKETQNFHTSVKITQSWLHDNFDSENSAVSNITDALERMSKIELQPELPDISSSLEVVKSLIHQVPGNIPGSEEPVEAPEQ